MEGSESQSQGVNCTAEIWDEVRNKFQSSIMVDTKLSSLAENVGTTEWPIGGPEETPGKYIYLTFEELKMTPGIGEQPQRIDLLVDIIKETLAFDDPFGDMVDQVEAASQRDDNVLKNLSRLEIPEEFPIIISKVSAGTKELCADEEIKPSVNLSVSPRTWHKTSSWAVISETCLIPLPTLTKKVFPVFFLLEKERRDSISRKPSVI